MRKTSARKRVIMPDPKFREVLVTKFVNNLMMGGKKSLAFKIFYESVDIVKNKLKDEDINGLDIFKKALKNITPHVEVKRRRVGGATFQIPIEIRENRKESMAMKWLINFARLRKSKSMSENLAEEILAASKEEGGAYKKKEDAHRMAEANKAFSHFRF